MIYWAGCLFSAAATGYELRQVARHVDRGGRLYWAALVYSIGCGVATIMWASVLLR